MNETAQEVDANPLDGKRVKMYRDFFLKEDVAAAVQWMKKQLKGRAERADQPRKHAYHKMIAATNEAFADVVDNAGDGGDADE